MKRLFLLIPVLVFSLLANAKEIEIGSSTSNIIHYTIAASSTSDGDVIVLTDAGPYVNSKANSDDYTKISKNVTIKAASGIHPVIKFEVPIQARDGKSGKFIGIKFDGSSLQYDHFIYFKDGNDNELEFEDCEFYNSSKFIVNVPSSTKAKSLVFRNCKFYDNTTNRGILNQGNIGHLGVYGCEFSGFVKDVIDGYTGTSHVDSCIVKNSYFHNHSRGSIFFEASTVDGTQTCDKLIVKNSTFANINGSGDYHSVIDIRPYSSTNTIKVEVDHCTFYNNTVINSDHANIRTANISDVTVSNCIFAYPSAYATRATYCTGGGNINNCLTYNYTADGTKGHAYGCTVNAASSVGNPLFNDLANNKYTFNNNWVTMSISPACGAATDGSDLGDPRWYSDPVVPSSNFASPYQFVGAKAQISGNIWYDGTNEYLYYNDKSENGVATWKIEATCSGIVEVTLNVNAATTNGHKLKVEVLDAEGNSIGETAEPSQTSASGDIVLPDQITLPATGIYTVKLYNLTSWSTAKIDGVTFAYAGGAAVDLSKSTPASLLANADAIVSDDWSIEDGKITHAESKATTGWAKWNVDCADYGNYNVTVNISSDNGHGMRVQIFEDESESAIYTLDEASSTKYAEGDLALDLGNITLSNREYVVKITNTMSSSHAEIASIVITYLNGARATLPATCTFADLILSTKAHVTDGNLWFNTIGDSNPVGQWAKWNIKAASAGTFLFTMNVSSTNGQSYKISILDMEENELDAFESGSIGSGDKVVKHYFNLAAGNYIVKLENTYSWSQGHIASLVVTQPSLITINDAATSNSVIHDNYRNGNHDIQIIRTITPGMYNTICLPFDVSSSQLPAIFGSDVVLRQMASATLSNDVLDLNFDNATSIYRGTPYLIKTTKTVSNPVFTDVEIKEEEAGATGGDDADFIGTFIKGTIPAGENNLFLGQNDLLYFSESATTIKGMRAYFQVNNPSGAPIRKARIVEQDNVVTELELIDGEWQDIKSANGTIKTIENGQLILIRDGKRYNVMGIRF